MKKRQIKNTTNSLMLTFCLTITLALNQLQAQGWLNKDRDTRESYEEVEEQYDNNNSSSFFSDMSKQRFESNYQNTWERTKYDYSTDMSSRGYDFTRQTQQVMPEYNWDNNQQQLQNQNQVIIGFGANAAGHTTPQNITAGAVNTTPLQFDVNPVKPPKIRDQTPELTPGNPGDPDVPVDGGILLLLAAAGSYGLSRNTRKK